MAYTIKGFLEIPQFKSNSEDTVAELGELSDTSKTFSTDKQYYNDAAKDVCDITVFSALDGNARTLSPPAVNDMLFSIMEKAFSDFTDTQTFASQLAVAFPDLTNISSGIEKTTLGHKVPVWLSFTMLVGDVDANVKVWMDDGMFQSEYDLHHSRVLPPVLNIAALYGAYSTAKSATNEVDTSVRFNELTKLIGKNPPTSQSPVELLWTDPTNPNNTISTTWIVVGYGPLAAIQENKLEAIREFLLANSEYTLPEWVRYIPELINVDLMYLYPQWNRVAITGSLQGDVLYSPTFLIDKGMENLIKATTNKSLETLSVVTDVITVLYKSLGVTITGDIENTLGKRRFTDAYPDYAIIVLNDPNMNGLRELTRSVLIRLEALVMLAEVDDGTQILPNGYGRISAGGIVYIEAIENGITFRIATKKTYLAIL